MPIVIQTDSSGSRVVSQDGPTTGRLDVLGRLLIGICLLAILSLGIAIASTLANYGKFVPSAATASDSPSDEARPTLPQSQDPKPILATLPEGFVLVADAVPGVKINLQYATDQSVYGRAFYKNPRACFLRQEAAEMLAKAERIAEASGLRIVVWDAYRPTDVQLRLWRITPDSRYIANPTRGGSNHNRGMAVDVTLCDANGKELEMPSRFDEFGTKSNPKQQDVTYTAKLNREILRRCMIAAGFTTIQTEWWHFDAPGARRYVPANVRL